MWRQDDPQACFDLIEEMTLAKQGAVRPRTKPRNEKTGQGLKVEGYI